METKWKDGDKVRIRRDLKADVRYPMETSSTALYPRQTILKYFLGAEVTIKDPSGLGYHTQEMGTDFVFTDGMLEETLPDVGISITREGRSIIAEDVFTGEKAVAKCHPDDAFDPKRGAALALQRLLNIPAVSGQDMMDELDQATGHILNVYLKLKKGEEQWKSKR